jgi:hypothetical protein
LSIAFQVRTKPGCARSHGVQADLAQIVLFKARLDEMEQKLNLLIDPARIAIDFNPGVVTAGGGRIMLRRNDQGTALGRIHGLQTFADQGHGNEFRVPVDGQHIFLLVKKGYRNENFGTQD